MTTPPVNPSLAVSPKRAAVVAVTQTQQFTAVVSGSQAGVTWSLNPRVGSLDPNSGFYVAPLPIAASQKVTVIATSSLDPTITGTATITLQPPPAVSVAVSPASASLTASQTQQFTATVQNSTMGVIWSLSTQVTPASKAKLAILIAAFTAGKTVSLRCENSVLSDFEVTG